MSQGDIAVLGIKVESGEAATAAQDLDKLAQAGDRAEKSTAGVSTQAKASGVSIKSLAASGKEAEQALDAYSRQAQAAGLSTKAYTAALRGVPAQFTDIVVSLQGGMNPFTVLLQQGGQLKDMFGGIGPATRALGGYVAGLVNPFTLAAAAAATLGVGYYKGSQEADEFRKSLVLTGNAAGTNVGALADLSKQISVTVGTTGAAAEVLAQLAGSGKIAGDSLGTVATAALEMKDATGRAVEETVAEFVEIGKDPVDAARKLNEQYNFLTAATYSQIVALKEQGDTVGAAKLLTDTYADTISSRSKEITENLGYIERAWRGVWSMTKNAGDAVAEFGRTQGIAGQLSDAQRELAEIDKRMQNPIAASSKRNQDEREIAQSRVKALQDQLRTQQSIDQAQENYRKRQRDSIIAMHEVDTLEKSAWTNAEKRADALQKYERALEKIRKTDPNDARLKPETIARVRADIEEQYKDPKTASSPVDLSGFNYQKNALSAILAEYKNHQKELDAAQKAGLISQESYASQRAAIIEQQKAEVTNAYEAEIKALEDAKGRSSTNAQQRIQLDQKIADARAAMVKAQKDADSELAVLATNEEGRLKRQAAAVQAYTDQLERERQVRATAGDRAAAALGMGDRQAGLQRELDGVSDEFNRKRETLLDRRRTAPDKYSAEDYKRDLAILEEAENRYRETVVGNYDKISAAQGDWRNGASSAFATYLEQARDVAGQTRTLFSNAFGNMEDAVVNFVKTGKLSFKDFADGVVEDLIRIQVRQAAAGFLSTAFGFMGGGGSSAGAGTMTGFSETISRSGFSGGGYTGDGGKFEPKGVVHGGEFVLRKEIVAQPGMRNYLEGLNLRGYASGGFVTPRIASTATQMAAAQPDTSASSVPGIVQHISVQGTADDATLARIQQAAQKGAQDGYNLVLRDLKTNGPARQLIARR